MGIENEDDPSIEIKEEKNKIYILPPLSERDIDNLKILILTDGNNRAKGLNQGYDDGGKNVVRIAEYLAQRGDVSKFVACIMSAENAAKRSEQFFWKLYQAFAALGARIGLNQTLVKDGIRLDVQGNLDELRERGGVFSEFADMVETVCKKTHHIEKPKLNLVLGINYDPDIAIDEDVDIIYRSGMEVPESVRLSGMRTHHGIKNFGSTTLWPNVETAEIESVLENTKKDASPVMHVGYNPAELVSITTNAFPSKAKDIDIHIPFCGNIEEVRREFAASDKKPMRNAIYIESKRGDIVAEYGTPGKGNAVHILPGSTVMYDLDLGNYDCIIAPGQLATHFTLPENPEADHATIFRCQNTPAAIVEAVQEAVLFCTTQERLQGGERKSSGEYRFEQFVKEFAHLEKLASGFKSTDVRELKERFAELEKKKNFGNLENYKKIKEVFVAFMFNWAKKRGLPINSEPQFYAFINYATTSLFMTYFPQYSQWEKHGEKGAERAFILGKYMSLVYMADEFIYDFEIPDQEQKKKMMAVATEILCDAAEGEKILPERVPADIPNREILLKIAYEIALMSHKFSTGSNKEIAGEWVESMQNLFKSFAAEWSEKVITDSESNEGEIHKTLLKKAPAFLREKIEQAKTKLGGNTEEQLDGKTDLHLYRYFLEIEDSIGAGITFRTLACTADVKNISKETMDTYRELCFLMNIFYRMANDISGRLSRNFNDRETKTDCCSIIGAKYLKKGKSEEESLIESIVELKKLMEEISGLIGEKRKILVKNWPLIGIAFVHADIAELIYGKGHYRTTPTVEMDKYIQELYYSAILPKE